MGISSNLIIAPTFDNLHIELRSLINPSDTSIQEEAKFDMYSAISNRTLGLKNLLYIQIFCYFANLLNLCALFKSP